ANNLRQCMRISINHQLSTINSPRFLPVLIDTARSSAFIKLDPRLLVFHGFQECFSLAFAHLALLFRFGFGDLCVLIRRLLRFVFTASSFHFTGKFLGVPRSRRRCPIFLFTLSWRWRRRFVLSFTWTRRFFTSSFPWGGCGLRTLFLLRPRAGRGV